MTTRVLASITASLIIFGVVVAIGLLFAFPFMWIWNYAIVKAITIANPIDYWTAYLLTLFIGLFFRAQISTK